MSSAGTVLEHPVVAGVRDAVAGLTGACGAATWQLSDAEVETGLASVLDLEAKAAALRAGLLREAEGRDLHSRTRAPSVEHWLGDRFRLSRADAAARMRSASVLGRHPTVEAALARGEVTVEQATVVTAALDRIAPLPEVSGDDRADAASFLVAQCAVLAPRDLARAGQAVVEALTVSPSEDDPADAAAVERDLARAEADAQAAERNELRVTRHRGRLRALLDLGALGEATLLAWLRDADKPHPGEDGFEDQRPLGERRGDALVDLLATAAATAQAPQPAEPAPVSPIALLTVTTTLAELQIGLSGAGRLDTDSTLSAATLRQLACDALLVPAVLGEPSEVLDLGRTTRVWNRAQRRAVALRDRGCVAPGCDRPPETCQVHHSWHWSDGGPTDLCKRRAAVRLPPPNGPPPGLGDRPRRRRLPGADPATDHRPRAATTPAPPVPPHPAHRPTPRVRCHPRSPWRADLESRRLSAAWAGRRAPGCGRRACGCRPARGRSRPRPGRSGPAQSAR